HAPGCSPAAGAGEGSIPGTQARTTYLPSRFATSERPQQPLRGAPPRARRSLHRERHRQRAPAPRELQPLPVLESDQRLPVLQPTFRRGRDTVRTPEQRHALQRIVIEPRRAPPELPLGGLVESLI